MRKHVVTFDPRPEVGQGAMDALHADAVEEDKARVRRGGALSPWLKFASLYPGAVNRIKAEAPDVRAGIASGDIPESDWHDTARRWVRR